MARTQAADYDRKREAITAVAAKHFAARGFSAASLAEIAADCDVSKSLIYHYYPSKEAILFDVMTEHMDALLEAAEDPAVAGAPTPEAKLHAVAVALLSRYTGAADAQRVLLYELDSLPKDQRAEIVGKQRALIGVVEAILAAIQPRLKTDRGERRARTMLFFSMLNWTQSWFKPTGALSRDALAAMIAETSLSSVR